MRPLIIALLFSLCIVFIIGAPAESNAKKDASELSNKSSNGKGNDKNHGKSKEQRDSKEHSHEKNSKQHQDSKEHSKEKSKEHHSKENHSKSKEHHDHSGSQEHSNENSHEQTEKPCQWPEYSTTTNVPTTPEPWNGGECHCNFSTIWLDVMILFEATPGVTNKGLQEMLGYVQTNFDLLNVQETGSSEKMSTRVGIVTYGKNTTLVYPLGAMSSDDMDNVVLPYYDTTDLDADLYTALEAAMTQFETASHRKNTRKIILLMASTYDDSASTLPARLIEKFQQNGGISIVYDYIQLHGIPAPQLSELANVGYYLNSSDSSQYDLNNFLCKANCFCSSKLSTEFTGSNSNGCFTPSEKKDAFSSAKDICKSSDGRLATADSYENSLVLRNSLPNSSTIWTGLTRATISNMYHWPNGNPMSDYRPWHSGSHSKECVTMGSDLFWNDADCEEIADYVCQVPLCSSIRYCE